MNITTQTERTTMKKHSIVALTLVIFTLATAMGVMAADPFVGTWKENVAKSKFNSGPPDKSSMVTFTAQENGLKLSADSLDADGKASHAAWAATFDGKDYPVTGVTDADTIAIKRIDANTFSELFKKAGKELFSARLVISKDGKTITRTTNLKNAKGQDVSNIYILEKQ
jgi:hypothetical protein